MQIVLLLLQVCERWNLLGLTSTGSGRGTTSDFQIIESPHKSTFSRTCVCLTGNHTRVDAEQAALKAACSLKARSNSCRGCVSLGAFGVPDYDIQVQTIATEPPYYCVTFQGRHGECLTLTRCHSPVLNMSPCLALPCLVILSPVNRT